MGAALNPTSTYFEDEHRHLFEDAGVEIVVERFRTNRDGDVVADVQPREALGDGFLPSEKLNLSSARSIKTFANTLAERPLQGELDWFSLLSNAARLSTERIREGEPHVWLRDVELAGMSRWLVNPFIVDRAISMIYGAGGSAKSVFALVLAIVVSSGEEVARIQAEDTGPVLVLDWEDDAETWTERTNAICAAEGIDPSTLDIAHQRMSTSLHDSAREVRKRIATTGARLVIIDSVGLASGGDPNDAGQIIRTLLAARSLKVPVLCIHHIAKDTKDPVRSGPYGSVYSTNEVRQSWYVAADQPEGERTASLALTNAKTNRSAKAQRQGFRIEFAEAESGLLETITVSAASVREMPEDITQPSQRWQLLEWLLEDGPRTYKESAEHLDTSEARVRQVVKGNPQMFLKLHGRPIRIGPLSSQDAPASSAYQSGVPPTSGTPSTDDGEHLREPMGIGPSNDREESRTSSAYQSGVPPTLERGGTASDTPPENPAVIGSRSDQDASVPGVRTRGTLGNPELGGPLKGPPTEPHDFENETEGEPEW
jgi:hypothetical protein